MASWLPLGALSIYLVGLIALAWNGDRRASWLWSPRLKPVIYSLSLAVYCTSWTFFGAVGTAARTGWYYLPIYLGPLLALTIGYPLWRRIAAAVQRENIGSIADFLASRYGKNRSLGMLVAVVAVAGTLPYIALQLKSIVMAWSIVSGSDAHQGVANILAATGLAAFAILFGVRRSTLTRSNQGLISATAVESLIKLAALVAVAIFAIAALPAARPEFWPTEPDALSAAPRLDSTFLTHTLLAFAAAFCLPRQFHVGFVELEDIDHTKAARWIFPGYLVITSLAIPAITAGGYAVLHAGGVDPDIYVLALPKLIGGDILTTVAFIGGLSAAAAMVTLEVVALSAMISNELLVPILMRTWGAKHRVDLSPVILNLRQASIVAILALATLYHAYVSRTHVLAEIGLSSFAAAAQFLPALVGGVLWRKGHWTGAVAGIGAGSLIWLVLVILPQLQGIRAAAWPLSMVADLSPGLVTGFLISLATNLVLYVGVSLAAKPRLVDRIQAVAFMGSLEGGGAITPVNRLVSTVGDLKAIVARFVGPGDSAQAFQELEARHGRPLRDSALADVALAREAERILAGAIGAPSARNVIALALADPGSTKAGDIALLLDQAAQAVHFNRELLWSALDSLAQGVCVSDAEGRVVAWNAAYLQMLGQPQCGLYVGLPIAELIRSRASLEIDPADDIEAAVTERLAPIFEGEPSVSERLVRGRILRSTGAPMPSGGYVISFTDVTELREAAAALTEANAGLERRVAQRTAEVMEANAALGQINEELAAAMNLAERAMLSQNRFIAAASHDLLQPLHAARLFIGAVAASRHQPGRAMELARDADNAIDAADRLLRSLLNLSRLEVGGVRPEVAPISVNDLLAELQKEFAPLASEKGLTLKVVRSNEWVSSDPDLLRSVLQNFIANAVRYSERGRILLGVRREGDDLRIEVHDSGPGIPEESQAEVFMEFHRLPGAGDAGRGMGLGLAIADRVCRLLNHPLRMKSRVGVGSTFMVLAPRCAPGKRAEMSDRAASLPRGLRVLCVDDEPTILKSTSELLTRWGVDATSVATYEDALALEGDWDASLIDFHLVGSKTGLDLARALADRARAFAIVTANPTESLRSEVEALGGHLIRKPASPGGLRAFLLSVKTTPTTDVSRPRQDRAREAALGSD